MFNEAIDYFKGAFTLNKTYLISNARAKVVSQDYENIHKKIEICLNTNTIVKELPQGIAAKNIPYEFKDFADINSTIQTPIGTTHLLYAFILVFSIQNIQTQINIYTYCFIKL